MNGASLGIYLHGKQVGELLWQGADCWMAALGTEARPTPAECWSLTQLTSTATTNRNVYGWFRSLLPEADSRQRLALQLGLTPGNEFALLAALGADCPGALSLRGAEVPLPAEPLTDFHGMLEEVLAIGATPPASLCRGLWPGDAGLLPVCQAPDGPRLASDGRRSDALLRFRRFELPEAVRNEAFCMQVAAALGVPVVPTDLLSGRRDLLLSGRPDVDATSPDGRCQLETFGQLAGLAPEQGFEREGGLTLSDCAQLIRRYSCAPALDLQSLLRWLVFCHLIGNGLACGRDLRFRFTPEGPRLAPFMEILSTHVHVEMSERLGFFIGREDRPDWLLPARWRELAEALGIGQRYLLALLKQMAQALPPALATTAERWQRDAAWRPVLDRVMALAGRRARQTWVALEAERG